VDICSEYNIIEAFKEYKLTIKDKDGSELNYGTADVLLITEDEYGNRKAIVIDYKFGFIKVSAFNNIQLQSYGLGACQEFDCVSCDYYIVQPAHSAVESGYFKDVDIVFDRVKSVIDSCHVENPTVNPTKEGCKYCKARFDCEARNKTQNELVLHMQTDISTYTFDQVADLLDKVYVLEGIMEDMKDQATSYVKNNDGNIERYKIIQTKGRSKPILISEAVSITQAGDLMKTATVSKTALEKAYVDAHYVKGTNTKKALKEAFKVKVTPILKYGTGTEKLVKN